MALRKKVQAALSEDGATNNGNFDARQSLINRQIGAEFLDLEKSLAWHGGWRLDQLVFGHDEHGWRCIVKVHRNGTPYCAFVNGGTLSEVIALTGEFADRGVLSWKKDDYPSKWLKKLLNRF